MSRLSDAHRLAARLDKAREKLRERRQEKAARERENGDGTTRRSRTATPDRSAVLGSEFDGRRVRTGEDPNTSRGFQFHRIAALAAGVLDPEYCKVELEASHQVGKVMGACPGFKRTNKTMLLPLIPAYLTGNNEFGVGMSPTDAQALTQKMWEPTARFDPDEAEWLTKKAGITNGFSAKNWTPDTQKVVAGTTGQNQSWMQQAYGGALIPFPEMGPIIPLLRNNNAMLGAGASVRPLPPGGRLALPRQDTASLVYHVGEGTAATQTDVQTDQFVLSPKKLIGLFVVNNELLRYGGPAVEQLFRNDMTLSLSLQLDFDCLQGAGSNNVIAGLIGYPGVVNYTASTNPTPGGIGSTGNTLRAVDVYWMQAQVYANNAPKFSAWIAHPLLWGGIQAARSSEVTANDAQGPFLFHLTRHVNEVGQPETGMADARVIRSTNCPTNRVKSTASNLTTLYGGWFEDYIIGMYGTVEIALSEQGQTWFQADQTAIRAILAADAGPQHPGTFIYYDQLVNSGTVS